MTTIPNLKFKTITEVAPEDRKVKVKEPLGHMVRVRHAKRKEPYTIPEGYILLTTETAPDVRKTKTKDKPLTNKRGELLFWN